MLSEWSFTAMRMTTHLGSFRVDGDVLFEHLDLAAGVNKTELDMMKYLSTQYSR